MASGNGISGLLNFKVFWGNMPPDPPRDWRQRRASGLPPSPANFYPILVWSSCDCLLLVFCYQGVLYSDFLGEKQKWEEDKDKLHEEQRTTETARQQDKNRLQEFEVTWPMVWTQLYWRDQAPGWAGQVFVPAKSHQKSQM